MNNLNVLVQYADFLKKSYAFLKHAFFTWKTTVTWLCRVDTELLHIHASIFGAPLKHASENLDGVKIPRWKNISTSRYYGFNRGLEAVVF